MINKNTIVSTVLLVGAWVILKESVSAVTVATGLVFGICALYIRAKILPLPRMGTVSVVRLAPYLLYLIAQIYIAGFAAIRLLFTGARVDIINVKISLSNSLSRMILAHSVTLVPGSVTIDLTDDELTVIWLSERSALPGDCSKAEDFIINKLEKMIKKIEN